MLRASADNVLFVCTVGGSPGTWVGVPYDSGWISTTAQTGWASNIQYRKIGHVVYLVGNCVRNSGTGSYVCVLPSGYRPFVPTGESALIFPTILEDGSAAAHVSIDSSGNVAPSTASNMTLDGVSFVAAD